VSARKTAKSGEEEAAALVLGGGRFGLLALTRLGGRVSAVVESAPSPKLLALAGELGVEVRADDGVAAARASLAKPAPPAWIVPCLPRHLLLEWLRLELSPLHPRLIDLAPGDLAWLGEIPLAVPGPDKAWCLSLTDSICPPDCPEPAGRCLKTGQERGRGLHDRLTGFALPGFAKAVLRSHQLAPGLGGLKSSEMLALRDRLAERGGRWLVATACRCHGILHALELDQPAGEGRSA
jgi:hypothetical protein